MKAAICGTPVMVSELRFIRFYILQSGFEHERLCFASVVHVKAGACLRGQHDMMRTSPDLMVVIKL